MSECLRSLRPYASLSLSSFSFILISSLPLLSSTLSDSSSFFSRSVGCAKRSCLRKEEAFFFFSTVRGERNRRGNWFRSRTRSKDSRFSFSYRRRKGFVFSYMWYSLDILYLRFLERRGEILYNLVRISRRKASPNAREHGCRGDHRPGITSLPPPPPPPLVPFSRDNTDFLRSCFRDTDGSIVSLL